MVNDDIMNKGNTDCYWMAAGEWAAVIFGVVVGILTHRQLPNSSGSVQWTATVVAALVVFKTINNFVHSGTDDTENGPDSDGTVTKTSV